MKELHFIDTTLRDAHQCLWATRMTTAMMLPIAPRMDEIGFEAIDLMGAVQFDVCVRYLRENPWDRIRLLRQAIQKTPLNGWVRSKSLISFDLVPDDVIELWVQRLAANGIRRLTMFDGLHDLRNLEPAVRAGKSQGLYLVGALVYSLSPVHTDELYARKGRELAAMGVEALLLKDPGGLLTPERVRTLVPALQAAANGLPLQLHSHCVTGLAPIVYLEAVALGVETLHTAISPLAHGPSQPPTELMVKHAGRLGRRTNLDAAGLEAMAAHFRHVAEQEGKPLGKPAEYDPFPYAHQVPGGMITNLKAQLAQLGIEQRLEEVLEEIGRVREELGYAIMVTPFSQLVGTQAVLNVIAGERYRTIPNEVVKYAFGHYGELVAPIAANVLDRIAQAPAAKTLTQPLPAIVKTLRAQVGGSVSDDELLLRLMFPEEHVRAMLAAGPIKTETPRVRQPLIELIQQLAMRRDVAYVHLNKEGLILTARMAAAPASSPPAPRATSAGDRPPAAPPASETDKGRYHPDLLPPGGQGSLPVPVSSSRRRVGVGVKRVLVANRGESAVRVIRACRALGLETVAIYAEADRNALHTRLADRAVCIGPARASQSYLNISALLAAALGTRCDAVHPGYGFLAENAAFAAACLAQGLRFVGPPPEVLRLMGDKLRAREIAAKVGIPVIPGSDGPVRSLSEAVAVAERLGYPLLLKASAGGGGRGMRVIPATSALADGFVGAQAEAQAAFGDGTLYAERFLPQVRHVEVQILGDRMGNYVHLGERDCSVQRRHQKILEETPSPVVSPALRTELGEAALALARHIGYENAGTVEFVLEPASGRFYFIEMNTRIQVEHPVTEMVTGLDLVTAQLSIAAGEPLWLSQADVRVAGHALECRINAEAADEGFRPCPGVIEEWVAPTGEGIRVDTHIYPGAGVPPFYDSLLAKLVVHASDRAAAIDRMREALGQFRVGGVKTTIPFHRRLLNHPDFVSGRLHTRWVEAELMAAGRAS